MIAAIAAAGVLVLCLGGGVAGWLLFLRDTDRGGAETEVAAVQAFLQAVYHDQDPAAAAALVCSQARDESALSTKIDELRQHEESEVNPRFTWTSPEEVERSEELAVLAVTVTMTTDEEKITSQLLHLSVLDKDPHGWWVCDVEALEPPEEPEEPAGDPTESPGEEEGDGE